MGDGSYAVEQRAAATVNGVRIVGALDRIDFQSDGSVQIVDYKTGTRRREKMLRPNEKDCEIGGDHWRQLSFYKLLADGDTTHNWQMSSGVIDYIEPQNSKFMRDKLVINDDDMAHVAAQITDVSERLTAHEFVGCREEGCRWCEFVAGLG